MGRQLGRTALYRLFDASDQLLYVGITEEVDARSGQHMKDKPWRSEVTRRDVEWLTGTRSEALETELRTIQSKRPLYNLRGTKIELPPPEQEFAKGRSVASMQALIFKLGDSSPPDGAALPSRGSLAAQTVRQAQGDTAQVMAWQVVQGSRV